MPLPFILLLAILTTGLCSPVAADELDLGLKPEMDTESYIRYRENHALTATPSSAPRTRSVFPQRQCSQLKAAFSSRSIFNI
jgi:hypothetical protein